MGIKSKFKEREIVKFVDYINENGDVFRNGKKLKINHFHKNIYPVLQITHKNKKYECSLHRAVWQFFNGNIPMDKEINHINCDRKDNRICNLELVTHSENIKKALCLKGNWTLKSSRKGQDNSNAKLSDNDVIDIKKRLSHGDKIKRLAEDYNVCITLIYKIRKGENWSHLRLVT